MMPNNSAPGRALGRSHHRSDGTTSLDQSYGYTGQTVGCDANAGDPKRATDDADLQSTLTPTGAAAIRTGVTPTTDANGKAVREGQLHRGGVQGFTAGSAFVEKHNFDGSDKAIDLRSTPATAGSAAHGKASDQGRPGGSGFRRVG
jgi:hypothetical protein